MEKFQWTDYKGEIKELPQIPAISDNIDFAQFVFPNDPSGKCMVHIPYNYFCLFAMKREQKIYAEALQEISKVTKAGKEGIEHFKHRLESEDK